MNFVLLCAMDCNFVFNHKHKHMKYNVMVYRIL